MFPQGGGQVLRFHEAHILAPGIGQDVAEAVHAAGSLRGEGNVVGRIIHLRLHSGSRFEALHGQLVRSRPKCPQPVAHDGVAAREPPIAQFLVQSHGGQVGIAFEQLRDRFFERVQQTRPACWLRFCHTGSTILVIR